MISWKYYFQWTSWGYLEDQNSEEREQAGKERKKDEKGKWLEAEGTGECFSADNFVLSKVD